MTSGKPTAIVSEYKAYVRRKSLLFGILSVPLVALAMYSITAGVYKLSLYKVVTALIGYDEPQAAIVIWNIRFPQIGRASCRERV